MKRPETLRVAIVQASPVFMDIGASVAAMCEFLGKIKKFAKSRDNLERSLFPTGGNRYDIADGHN